MLVVNGAICSKGLKSEETVYSAPPMRVLPYRVWGANQWQLFQQLIYIACVMMCVVQVKLCGTSHQLFEKFQELIIDFSFLVRKYNAPSVNR